MTKCGFSLEVRHFPHFHMAVSFSILEHSTCSKCDTASWLLHAIAHFYSRHIPSIVKSQAPIVELSIGSHGELEAGLPSHQSFHGVYGFVDRTTISGMIGVQTCSSGYTGHASPMHPGIRRADASDLL